MLVLLAILIFIYNFAAGLYLFSGVEPSPTVEFLYAAAFPCAVVWWLKSEARGSAVVPVYCPGLLLGLGWLFVIPYHLLQTRGVRGLLPLLALIASFLVAQLLAVIVYFAVLSNLSVAS